MAPSQESEDVISRSHIPGTKARNSQANPEQFSPCSLWGGYANQSLSLEGCPRIDFCGNLMSCWISGFEICSSRGSL